MIKLKYIFIFLISFISFYAFGQDKEVKPSFRHMIILQADTESLWGSYYFAVNNPNISEASAIIPILLPKETIHFEPGEQITADQIHLDDSGKLLVKKQVPPGLHLMSVRFQTKHSSHSPYFLHFEAAIDMEEFSVIYDKKTPINLTSSLDFFPQIPAMVQNGSFQGITAKAPIKKGQDFIIEVKGLPENRDAYWLMGWVFFALLILSASFLSFYQQKHC